MGYYSGGGGFSNKTIKFPRTFSNIYIALAASKGTSTGYGSNSGHVDNLSNTGMTAVLEGYGYWIAIGIS